MCQQPVPVFVLHTNYPNPRYVGNQIRNAINVLEAILL